MKPNSISSRSCDLLNFHHFSAKRFRSDEQKTEESDGTTTTSMDEKIWGEFPEDLMIRVLSWLPVSTIVRSNLVCRSWKSIIASSLFLKLYSEISPNSHHPWFLIFPRDFRQLGFAYDPCLNRWVNLSFYFLPFAYRPIAVGDGFVCLHCKSPHSGFGLYICNPISTFHTKISMPMSLFRYFFLVSGLIFDRASGVFMVVLVGSDLISNGSDQFVLTAEVYDSRIKLWIRIRSFPVDYPVSPWRTISNGVLYCVMGLCPWSIIGFDLQLKHWFMLKAPIPQSLTGIRLMDHRNKLVMIGGVGFQGITEEIGIWQLDDSGAEWIKIGEIPKDFCDLFLRSPSRQFSSIGHGDLIYFTSKKYPYVVMYDISRKYWKLLDSSLGLLNPYYHSFNGFCFEPRLL